MVLLKISWSMFILISNFDKRLTFYLHSFILRLILLKEKKNGIKIKVWALKKLRTHNTSQKYNMRKCPQRIVTPNLSFYSTNNITDLLQIAIIHLYIKCHECYFAILHIFFGRFQFQHHLKNNKLNK